MWLRTDWILRYSLRITNITRQNVGALPAAQSSVDEFEHQSSVLGVVPGDGQSELLTVSST